MEKKLVGIFISMLVLATALPAVGIMNKNIEKNIEPLLLPGIEWRKTYGGEEFN